jgi:HEAT repeat protein
MAAVGVAAALVLVATIVVIRTNPGAGKVPADSKNADGGADPKKDDGGGKDEYAPPPPVPEMSPKAKALLPGLKSEDAGVRREAARALGKLGDKAAVDALVERIADDFWGRTKGHARELPNETPYEDVATGPNQGSKYAALDALQKLAPERMTEALQRALKSRQPRVVEWAVRNLADQKANGTIVQAVADQLAHKEARVRREAVRALGKLGDKAAVPALIKRIADDTWGRVKGPFPETPNDTPYEDVATGSNQGSKYAALEALNKLSPQEAMKALEMAQQSKNPEVRKWATNEYGRH